MKKLLFTFKLLLLFTFVIAQNNCIYLEYTFNNSLLDSGPNNIQSTGSNIGFGLDRNGNTNLALQFNSSSVFQTSGMNLPIGADDFSVEFWIKTNQTGVTTKFISKRPTCTFSSFWEFQFLMNGQLRIAISEGQQIYTVRSNMALNDDQWHYILFIKDGADISLYADCELQETTNTGSALSATNSSDIVFGNTVCVPQDISVGFVGLIDEFRIYDCAIEFQQTLGCSPPVAIPTMGEWGLIILGLTLFGIGLIAAALLESYTYNSNGLLHISIAKLLHFNFHLLYKAFMHTIGIGFVSSLLIFTFWGEITTLDFIGLTISCLLIFLIIYFVTLINLDVDDSI